MRQLGLWLFGRELVAVRWGRPDAPGPGEHDNATAQVERAEPAAIGFVIERNPSCEPATYEG